MKIQKFEITDLDSLPLIQPSDWVDIRPMFQFYYISAFCRPVKMEHEGLLLGVGCAIKHVDTAWLGHIIVHPDHQGKGIGTSITMHLLELLSNYSFRSISLVSTPAGVPMYEKIGFQKQWKYIFYNSPQKFIPPIKQDCIYNYQQEFLEEIFMFDLEVSQEDRKAVIGMHLNKCRLFIFDGSLDGIYFPTLGEGLILARSEDAGLELAKERILQFPKSVVPAANRSIIQLLEKMEMKIGRTGTRMFIGQPIKLKVSMLYNRIGGNIG